MAGAAGAVSYRAVLADRRLALTFALALAGRLGYAVLPLSLLFTIVQATGSFPVAATSTALFGLGALAMPVQARALDRFGQRRVLPAIGSVFVAFLVAAAVLGSGRFASASGWGALCLVGGIVAPALGPSMRAQWREAVDAERRSAAYSLDAVAEEVVFLVGPLVSAATMAVGPAWRGVALAAVLLPIGVAGLVASPFRPAVGTASGEVLDDVSGASSAAGEGAGRWLGPLRRKGFQHLLLTMALAGTATSATLTVVAAMADRAGRPAVTGLVEAGAGVASAVGGLWWGRRPASKRWNRELAVLLAARAPLMLGAALVPRLGVVGVLVAVSGFVLAPVYVVGFTASDQESEPRHHTEASTWVTTLNNLGSSVGTAAAGWLFVKLSVSAVFAVLAVQVVVASAVAAARQPRRWFSFSRPERR